MSNILTLARVATACLPLLVISAVRAADDAAAPAPTPSHKKLTEIPPGNHKLLETMTTQYGLTHDQQLEIEPLLHDEESVTKPILGFAPLTVDERNAMMLTVKMAARRQIRPVLNAEQQAKFDEDVKGAMRADSKAGKTGGGKKGGKKKAPAEVTAQTLIGAINAYGALNADEKKAMIIKVNLAASRTPSTADAAPVSATASE